MQGLGDTVQYSMISAVLGPIGDALGACRRGFLEEVAM